MKKIFSALLAFSMVSWYSLPVFSADIQIMDVANDYWARPEIVDVVSKNVMSVDQSGNFTLKILFPGLSLLNLC